MTSSGAPPPQRAPAGAPPALELTGISKRFPGVVANDGVDLRVDRATVHAVVGENGAGKSTLMKIAYGLQRPDAGTITVHGRPVTFRSPRDAIAAGIGMVHQHVLLADNLTVWENVVLGAEPTRAGRLDAASARASLRELGQRYGLPADPDALVEQLGVGDRQRVEILKVLYRGAQTLILDEPTAVLVPQEVDELFASLADLTREGVTVLFISHKLDEVLRVADAITVMRAGRTVATVVPSEVTARKLAELMVGDELPSPETRESTVTETVELAVEGVTVAGAPGARPVVDDVSFVVRRGEIVGIAGVEGNGQPELLEVLMGLRPLAAGRIVLAGEDIGRWSTRRRREAGIGFIPEDRHRSGLLLPAPLWENGTLGHQTQTPFAHGPWIDRRAARERTREVIAAYDVKAPGCDTPAYALSGGNQQKAIVGRELTAGPRVLLAAHPTRGIDVGAQADVWEHLRRARHDGLALVLVSADLEELIGLSDTLLVLYRGRIVARLDPSTVTPEELGATMTGAGPAGQAGGTPANPGAGDAA